MGHGLGQMQRSGLDDHDLLFLNRDVLKKDVERWTEESIRNRTTELSAIIIAIWRSTPR